MNYIIPLVIFTPLMMSLFIMSPLFSDDEKIIRRTAKGFSIFHFTLMILLTAFFNFSQSEFTIKTSYKWIEVLGINANFEFDSLSLLLTVLTSFIFLLSVFISKNMIKRSYRLYYSLIFVLQSAVTGVFGAGDLFCDKGRPFSAEGNVLLRILGSTGLHGRFCEVCCSIRRLDHSYGFCDKRIV